MPLKGFLHQRLQSLDCMLPINFSSFIAFPMSPLIFSLPVMNAEVALSLPTNKY